MGALPGLGPRALRHDGRPRRRGVALHVPEPLAAVQARPGPARDVGPGPGARRRRRRPASRAWVDGHARREAAAGRAARRRPTAPPRRASRRRADRPTARRPRAPARRARRPPRRPASSSSTAGSTTASAPASPIPALARYATWDDARRPARRRPGRRARQPRAPPRRRRRRPPRLARGRARRARRAAPARRRPASACPSCPAPLADAVATACGWQVRQADVLAGVPDTDTWVVAGRSDTREDRIEVRRTWLRGATHGPVGDGALVRRLPPVARHARSSSATAFAADLHRYPGPSWRRASSAPCHEHGAPTDPVAPPAGDRRRGVRRGRRGAGRRAVARPRAGHRSSPRRRSPAAGGCSPTTPARSPWRPTRPAWPTLLAASAGDAGRPSPSSGRSTAPSRSPSTSPTARSTSARAPTSSFVSAA